MDKEELKKLAEKLMFSMNEDEYETLSHEFKIILKQMDLIGKIEGIDEVEPLIYPNKLENVMMREDMVNEELPLEEILANSSDVLYNQVRVPKVVE